MNSQPIKNWIRNWGWSILIASSFAFYLHLNGQEIFAAQTQRAYGKTGNSAGTNATITVPFNPLFLRVCNEGTTNAFMIDFTDGVATADDDSTNIKIGPGLTGDPNCRDFTFSDKNVNNTFTVGILQVSGASAYNLSAWR